MDTTDAPQIIEHLSKTLNFTPFEVKWVPGTAKFILGGQTPKATGTLQLYQLNKQELSQLYEIFDQFLQQINRDQGVKCSSFGASPVNAAQLAIGDFKGQLEIVDLETKKTIYSVQAHEGIVNCLDAIGGNDIGYGAPEIVTGGRDGCVRVWDQRQKSPVLSLEPAEKNPLPDCWSVGFGNSYNDDERCIAAGYDNGDLKIFDLRQNSLKWETNLKNGICGIEFDRKDIMMNKIVATTLESKFHVFDLRTFNTSSGYAGLEETAHKSTIWGAKHLPQNREIFATQGGNGAINLYKYRYPKERSIKDQEGRDKGVIGTVDLINSKDLHQQPISSFDWNKDKIGLSVMCGFDQQLKVCVVTKLNLY